MTKSQLTAGVFCATLAGGITTADAGLFLGFDDQDTVGSSFFTGNTGDATAVDQYGGIAGDGWTSGWVTKTGGSTVRNKRVLNTGSFAPGGGNFLQIEHLQNNGTSFRSFGVQRDYGNFEEVDITQAANYEFYYRVDSGAAFAQGGGGTFIQISDGFDQIFNSNDQRWTIRSIGDSPTNREWAARNGDGEGGVAGLVDSNVAINVGDVYKFNIFSDPTTKSWELTVQNITQGDAAVTLSNLTYINDVNTLGGELFFGSQIAAVQSTEQNPLDSTYTFSIDDISITGPAPDPVIPEPASAALVALGGLALMTRRRG